MNFGNESYAFVFSHLAFALIYYSRSSWSIEVLVQLVNLEKLSKRVKIAEITSFADVMSF